jgi:hypothetical protein
VHKSDFPPDASAEEPVTVPADASPVEAAERAAYEALVMRYADKAFERIAPTIAERDAPAVRAGLEVFFRTNPRAKQLLEQLRAQQRVEKSGTTSRGDEASLKAAIGKKV